MIGGVESYIATPQGDYQKDAVILLLTDVFGIPLINNKVCLLVMSIINFNILFFPFAL